MLYCWEKEEEEEERDEVDLKESVGREGVHVGGGRGGGRGSGDKVGGVFHVDEVYITFSCICLVFLPVWRRRLQSCKVA